MENISVQDSFAETSTSIAKLKDTNLHDEVQQIDGNKNISKKRKSNEQTINIGKVLTTRLKKSGSAPEIPAARKKLRMEINGSKKRKNNSSTSESDDNETESVKQFNYKCCFNECNQKFRREKDLDKHEFQHTGVAKYSCNYSECTKKYRLRAHLKRHIQTTHEKTIATDTNMQNTIKCEIDTCSKQFLSKYSLKRHLKDFHGKIKKFPCTDCDRVYERKNHLKLHRVTHTKEYPYKCYKCEEGFVSEVIFKRHNCSKHNCDNCDETFKKWSELVKHRHESHPQLLHVCDKCNVKCTGRQELKSHKKLHKERQSCPWEGCTNSYLDRRNLKNHINIKHLNQKFQCTFDGCDKELSSKSKLNYHLRLHEIPPAAASNTPNDSKIDNTIKKTKRKATRKKRKDAGIAKKSMVGVLANFVLTPQIDRILKQDIDSVQIENFSEHDTTATSETDDGEDKSSKTLVQIELKVQNT